MLPLKFMLEVATVTVFFVYFAISVVDSQSQSVQNSNGTTRFIYPWDKKNYPNPALQHQFCRMHALSTICDPDDIFSERQKVELDRLTRNMRQKLKCYCSSCSVDSKGLSVGIASMMSIYRDFKTEPKNATIDFADYLRKEWNLGSCNNDIIIVITTKDRSWYPSFGETAQRVLPTHVWDKIIAKAQESFYEEHFYEGLSNMLSDMFKEIDEAERRSLTTQSPPRNSPKKETNIALIVSMFCIVLAVLVVVAGVIWGIMYWRKKRQEQEKDSQRDAEEKEKFQKDKELGDDTTASPGYDSGRSTWDTVKNKFSFKKSEMTPVKTSNPDEIITTGGGLVYTSVERKSSTDMDEIDTDLGAEGGGRPVYADTTEALP